jgi:trehalose 6-phosphate synthase
MEGLALTPLRRPIHGQPNPRRQDSDDGRLPARGMVVVANRLPVQRVTRGNQTRWTSSPGGLVRALEPIVRGGGGAWVGWTGNAGSAPRQFVHDGLKIRPVPLSTGDLEGYYHGFSNRTIWPLFHDAIRPPEFRREWWWPYRAVNEKFARAVAGVSRPGELVWVHDYHLMLAPQMIRELRPDLRIGFFLHIPFPPEELFAWLPWRTQLLEGLLGADVVGFQTYQGAQNFSRAARAFTAAEGTDTELSFQGRLVRSNAFPISIDALAFEEMARKPETEAAAREIRERVGGRKIILGVDRLDYTKGMDIRLLAFNEVMKRGRFTVDDCVLMQIAVPSRERVGDYADLRTKVEQLVGRINGDYSMPGRVAVHYFRRSLSPEDLIVYYRAADVMLVTPLRDGMNLVAKEYVATRYDGTGVLVLSEFAGAAREFRRALLVNPRDVDSMAVTMEQALELPKEDARHRMNILRTVVKRHDVFEWAAKFVEAMEGR